MTTQIFPNIPSLNDLLNRISKGTEISLATALSIQLLIASGPLALFGFKNSVQLEISQAVQDIFMSFRLEIWKLYTVITDSRF